MTETTQQRIERIAKQIVMKLPPDILMHPMPFPDRLDYGEKLIKQALAAFAEEEANKWQPIETIPFGVPVLVTNGKVVTCTWLRKCGDGIIIHHSHGWRGEKWDFTFNPDKDLTHWQPLPPAPSTGEKPE